MIRIRGLTKIFQAGRAEVRAVRDVTLDIEPRSFFTLLGPSGCGKTTILRCVAGLETPESGEISIEDAVVFSSRQGINVPPNRRNIGMVFQSYAVWPHMTVYENVAFPLEVRHVSGIRERVMRSLAMVGLAELSDRYTSTLSGGQQQRVALARAVVAEPDVLLLDEPLSNLDAALRNQMRTELRHLQETLKVTTLFVTHDQTEALSMSDRIAVVREGRVLEVGAPHDLYHRPRDIFTAQFIGGGNLIAGRVPENSRIGDGPHVRVETGFGTVHSSGPPIQPRAVRLFVRPEKVGLVAVTGQAPARVNVFPCTVKRRTFGGDRVELELALADGSALLARVSGELAPESGSEALVQLDPRDVAILQEQ
jgi:iron(III) transport system ATP-binding protein